MATRPSVAKSEPQVRAASFHLGRLDIELQIEGAARGRPRRQHLGTFCRQKGRIVNGDTGDTACDHYHRFSDDIALMRDMGVDAYRFSVAWPRVLPKGHGTINEAGLAFYDRLIDALLAARIEPWLCLYHWDLPQALDDVGGWKNRDSAGWFADYAMLIGRRFGDRVKRFATFNEPCVFTLFGYAFGRQAPGLGTGAAPRDPSRQPRARRRRRCVAGRGDQRLDRRGSQLAALPACQSCCRTTRPRADSPTTGTARSRNRSSSAVTRHRSRARSSHTSSPATWLDLPPVDWFGLNHYSPNYVRAELGKLWASASATPGRGAAYRHRLADRPRCIPIH